MADISIIIPTYNRATLLLRVLHALTEQKTPASTFEVIIADDGSTDDTAHLVKSFASEWNLKYAFQEDLGYRAAAARNTGAKIAETGVLVFLDSGTIPGPEFVSGHLSAHQEHAGEHPAVIAPVYGYGFSIRDSSTYVNELANFTASEIRAAISDDTDPRQEAFRGVGSDINKLTIPPILFWSGNCSVASQDFWAVGGFDEKFEGWGMEDVDLGYRLWSEGASFFLRVDAWAIELPHPRHASVNMPSFERNIQRFLAKNNFSPPPVEIFAVMLTKDVLFQLEDLYSAVLRWQAAAKNLNVRDELKRYCTDLPATNKIGIFGVGGDIPPSVRQASLFDFDAQFAGPNHRIRAYVQHSLGLRTHLDDKALDVVLITSRMRGIWDQLGEFISAEANRIARSVALAWKL